MFKQFFERFKIMKFDMDTTLRDGTPIKIVGDLAVGAQVYIIGPDKEIPIGNGDYFLSTGEQIIVEDGVITEVIATPEEAPDEVPVEVEIEEKEAEVEPEPEVVEDAPDEEDLTKVIDGLIARIEALENKVKDKMSNDKPEDTSKMDKMQKDIEKIFEVLEKSPSVKEVSKHGNPKDSNKYSSEEEYFNYLRNKKNNNK